MSKHLVAAAAALEAVLMKDNCPTAVVFGSGFTERAKASVRERTKRVTSVVVTVGPLNYAERKYIKLCRKHGTNPRRFWFPGAKAVEERGSNARSKEARGKGSKQRPRRKAR